MTGLRGSSNSIGIIIIQIFGQRARTFVHDRLSSNIALKITLLFGQPSTRGRSVWVCLVIVGAAFLVAYVVYRNRVRRIEAELTTQFHKRLSERARLAIDLNDSLLQTIEASKYIADDALDPSSDLARTRSAMGRVSYWLGKAALEGQTALNSWRRTSSDGNDLASAFLRAAEEFPNHRPFACSVNTTGISRDMNPRLRDDIYLLGTEIINALSQHDGESRLEIVLKYGRDFCLQIRSSGAGQSDAFDLARMQKRAQQFGATLSLTNSSPSTMELTLTVPGSTTFTDATTVFPQWLLDLRNRLRTGRRKMP